MKILHIIPYFNLVPPSSGGALRCLNLAKQLSAFSTVDAVVLQVVGQDNTDGLNINFYYPGKVQIETIKRTGIVNKIKNTIAFKTKTRLFFRPADFNFIALEKVISHRLRSVVYDVVVFEHYQSMLLSKQLRKYFPKSLFILDAHNVDHLLLEEENKEQKVNDFDRHYSFIKKIESNLSEYVSLVWTCSENDADIFRRLNSKGIKVDVIPNGVDTNQKIFIEGCNAKQPTIAFCGDLNTVANKSGLTWFMDHIWPLIYKRVDNIQILIAGNGDKQIEFEKYKNLDGVKFLGKVPDLFDLYKNANISIAPLTVGSGTRLKILEALSYGIPMVATSKAAEGVPYKCGDHLLLADTIQSFSDNVVALLNNPELQEKLRLNGRSFVEQNFDWKVVGDRMKTSIFNSKK